MSICPRKYRIIDLVNKPAPFDVWIQGTIEQTVGTDILIVSDGPSRTKVTKCGSADGIIDKNSLRKGTYCCIIGTVVRTKGLPEVQASKVLDLSSQPLMKTLWEHEVRDADLYLQGKMLLMV